LLLGAMWCSNPLGQGLIADPVFQFGVVGVGATTLIHLIAGSRVSSHTTFLVLLLYSMVDMLYSMLRPISDLLEDLERTYSSMTSVAVIWTAVGLVLGLQSHSTSYSQFLALSIVEAFSLGTMVVLLARTGDTRVMTVLPACIDLPLCCTVYAVVWIREMLRESEEVPRPSPSLCSSTGNEESVDEDTQPQEAH